MTTLDPPASEYRKTLMARDRIREEWPDIADRIRRRWHKLTVDDVAYPEGSAEYLAGVVQERYGVERSEALLQVYEFESEL